MTGRMSERITAVALACLAAVAAWLTAGALAVTDAATSMRVGLLPPWWTLAVLLVTFVGAVLLARVSVSRLAPLALTGVILLPWLPGPVPPAFLLWHGPLAVLVWGLVLLGLLAPVWSGLFRTRWATSPRHAPLLLAALTTGLLLAAAWNVRPVIPSGDEPHYLVITQSLLLDGDLRIENNHQREDYLRYTAQPIPPDYLQRGLDGQIYSVHAPGVSVLVAPAFALGGYPLVVVFLSVLAGAGLAALWWATWRLTGDVLAAWVGSASVGLCVPMFFSGFTVFPDGTGAVCVAVALGLLVALERGLQVPSASLTVAGAVLALLPWLHTRFALVAGVLGSVIALRLLVRPGGPGAVTRFLAIPAVAAVAWFGFFWAIWGTPNPAVPYGGYTQSSLSYWVEGVPGLLIDQQFGLLTTAPVLLAGIAGLWPLGRRHPRLALELVTLSVTYLLAVAAYRMWWGGHSVPARFLVVVLPAMALPLSMAWIHGGRLARAAILLLLVLSLGATLVRAAVGEGSLVYNTRDGVDLTLSWLSSHVNLPLAFPSLHRDTPAWAAGDALVWLTVAVLVVTLAARVGHRRGDAWTVMGAAALIIAMLSTSMVWAQRGVPPVTPASSAMDALDRWSKRASGVGWRSRPFGTMAADELLPQIEMVGGPPAAVGEGPVRLLHLPVLHAGTYEVVTAGSSRLGGTIDVHVGSNVLAIERLAASPDGPPALFHLPVSVRDLSLMTDRSTALRLDRVVLRPRQLNSAAAAPAHAAIRAARYGQMRWFFLDEGAYVERSGVWTRANGTAELLIDAPAGGDAPLILHLRAGAAPVRVSLRSGDWQEVLSLHAETPHEVRVPPASAGWRLSVQTEGGFRPSDLGGGRQDRRHLGVRIEPAMPEG